MLRQLTLGVLSMFLSITLTLLLFGLAAQQLLYPEPYLDALERNDAYAALGQTLPGAVHLNFEPAVERALTDTLRYLRGDASELLWRVDLPPEAALAATFLPPCGPQEEFSFENPTCVPPEAADGYLDVLPLVDRRGDLERARLALQHLRLAMVALAVTAGLLVLLIFFLNRRSIVDAARWVEADLVMVGGSLLFSSYLVRSRLADMVVDVGPLGGVLADLVVVLLSAIAVYGGVMLGIGLFLMLGSIAFRMKKVRATGFEPA